MIDIATLTPEERLELIARPWDSLSSAPQAVPFPESHREELDRRLDELDREDPTPAGKLLSRLRSRRG